MITEIILACVWIPLTFLLHNAIHEGSHIVLLKKFGAKIQKMWLLPSYMSGRFTFAYVEFSVPKEKKVLSDGEQIQVYSAPLLVETLWLILFGLLLTVSLVFDFNLFVKLFFAIECLAAIVDMTTWWLGWIRTTLFSDGCVVRDILAKK